MDNVEILSSRIILLSSFRRKGNFIHSLGEYFRFITPDNIHYSHLRFFTEKTFFVVLVGDIFPYNRLFYSFAFLLFLSFKHPVTVKFRPQPNKLFNDPSTSLIFHHTRDFFVFSQQEFHLDDLLENCSCQSPFPHPLKYP